MEAEFKQEEFPFKVTIKQTAKGDLRYEITVKAKTPEELKENMSQARLIAEEQIKTEDWTRKNLVTGKDYIASIP